MSDNVIRPMLISRGAKIPFLVVLLGVLGGLVFGGIVGHFVGATLLVGESGQVSERIPGRRM